MLNRLITVIGTVVTAAGVASGQCEPVWVPIGGYPGIPVHPVVAVAGVAMDAAAGTPDRLFAAYGGSSTFSIAQFVDGAWTRIPESHSSTPYSAMTGWDPDGPGLLRERMIVADGPRVRGWLGTSLAAMGPVFNHDVKVLFNWDPDGSGPQPGQLIAGGRFWQSGSASARRIASWNGTSWQPVGGGVGGSNGSNMMVKDVCSWDPDGPGPQPSNLVVAGFFDAAGAFPGIPALNIARFDGSQWHAFGAGLTGEVISVAVQGSEVLAVAAQSGQLRVMRWDGSQWQQMGSSVVSTYQKGAVRVVDFDGSGPREPEIYLGIESRWHDAPFYRWDGSGWAALGDVRPTENVAPLVGPIEVVEVDGAYGLLCGGHFLAGGGRSVRVWGGDDWLSHGEGMDGTVSRLAVVDTDGTGPIPAQLAALGEFRWVPGRVAAPGLAVFDHHGWTGLPPVPGTPTAIAAWDSDWSGPEGERLVAAGWTGGSSFSATVQVFDGTQWQSMGAMSSGPVNALLGTHLGLVAGGGFSMPPQQAQDYTIRWLVDRWVSVVTTGPYVSVGGSVSAIGVAKALNSYDSNAVYFGASTGIWRAWNNQWTQIGGSGSARALIGFDLDGPGGSPPRLIAGVDSGTYGINALLTYDGVAWSPLGNGFQYNTSVGDVEALAVWDIDGHGPGEPKLIAGGRFTASGARPISGIAYWDEGEWHAFSAGVAGDVKSLAVLDPDGPGPEAAWLAVGGTFTHAGGSPSGRFAWLRPGSGPQITQQPAALEIEAGQSAVFSALGAGTGLTYAWRRNGEPLLNGPTGTGSTISGCDSPTLRVDGVGAADSGAYVCVVFNGCSTTATAAATLTIRVPACPADWDGSGGVDGDDIGAFFADWTAGNADIDESGGNDGDDIAYFFARWQAGC